MRKFVNPFIFGQLDAVAGHFIALLRPSPSIFTEQPWILHSKTRKSPALCHPTMTILFRMPLLTLLNHLSILTIFMQLSPIWSLSLLMLIISPNPPKDGLRLLFSPLMPVRVSQATSTPTPKKLLAMVITVSVGCVLILVTLHPDDPNLRNSLFVFLHHLFLILSVVLADLPASPSSRISPFSLTTHFPTLFIFAPHRPDRESSPISHPGPFLHRGGTPASW